MKYATVKLRAPDGVSGVSVDGEDYRVDGGVVEVPQSIADTLIESHGYKAFVPEPEPKKKAARDGVI